MNEKEREKIGGSPTQKDWGKQQPIGQEHAGSKPRKEGIKDRDARDPNVPGSKPVTK